MERAEHDVSEPSDEIHQVPWYQRTPTAKGGIGERLPAAGRRGA